MLPLAILDRASHFAPDHLMQALDNHRTTFKPSAQLQKPYAMAGINVLAANTDAGAQRLLACSFAGSPQTLRRKLPAFMAKTGVDELMAATAVCTVEVV